MSLPDTDWEVESLYAFAPSQGIGLLRALYSRLMVDLNRPRPGELGLYADKNRLSPVVALKTFFDQEIYLTAPDTQEIDRRLQKFYEPYYQKLEQEIQILKAKHGRVLLIDAHSIKGLVPKIRPFPFAEFNFSDRNQKTCHQRITETCFQFCKQQSYSYSYNDPFLGGNITRSFARPDQGIFTLQIELNQSLYMDDEWKNIHPCRRDKLSHSLHQLVTHLASVLKELA